MGRLQVQWWCRCRGAEQEEQRAKKVQSAGQLQASAAEELLSRC